MDADKADHTAAAPGLVAIQGGRVVVRMPTPESMKPTIAPGPHVVLKVNGEVVTQSVQIDDKDEVIVETAPEPPSVEVRIDVAKDASEAIAHILRRPGITYVVKEAAFASHLDVAVRPSGRVPAPFATVEQIRDALAHAGVVYGIDDEAIQALVARTELEVKGVVARGTPPTEPVDGHVRPYRSHQSDLGIDTSEDALKVDLLDRGEVLSVNEGDIVGEWIEPEPGQDGRNVRGEPVRARKPKPVRVKLGKGVSREEGSRFIVAVRMGRPVITEKLVDVVPSYDVPGDVNVATGHVEFAGDVSVRGNVEESLRVRAGGSVAISGMVFRKARVEAGGSVSAKGVVGGYVEAGGNSGVYTPVVNLLRRLAPLYQGAVENLRRIQSTLQATGATQPLGVYFKALLERHYSGATRLAEGLGTFLNNPKHQIDDELKDALASIVRHLTGRGPLRVSSVDDLTSFAELLEIIPVELEARISEADVKVGYLQNAEIVSGGTVIVTGRACYNSKVIARNGFQAPGATVRGGTINVTHGSVVAKEIGSPAAPATEILVAADGVIKAEMIYPNVLCTVGTRHHRIESLRRRVEIRLDPQTGELRF